MVVAPIQVLKRQKDGSTQHIKDQRRQNRGRSASGSLPKVLSRISSRARAPKLKSEEDLRRPRPCRDVFIGTLPGDTNSSPLPPVRSATDHVNALSSNLVGLRGQKTSFPADVAVRVDLETPSLEPDVSGRTWVSLTIQTRLSTSVKSLVSQPLDTVIVVDNSTLLSETALQAARDITELFAIKLTDTLDRLAVVCSSLCTSSKRQSGAPNVITPLRTPQASTLKEDLGRILACQSNDSNTEQVLREAVALAQDLLTSRASNRSADLSHTSRRNHVFILTACLNLPPDFDQRNVIVLPVCFTRLYSHIPSEPTPSVTLNYGSYTDTVDFPPGSSADDTWLDGKPWAERVTTLLACARTDVPMLALRHLRVDLQPSPGTRIENYIPGRHYHDVSYGQPLSILVRVYVLALTPGAIDVPERSQPETSIRDIQYHLGTMDLFDYSISYHDADAAKGGCAHILEGTCFLSRPTCVSPWSMRLPQDNTSADQGSLKRLMISLCQQSNSRRALRDIAQLSLGDNPSNEILEHRAWLKQELRMRVYMQQPNTTLTADEADSFRPQSARGADAVSNTESASPDSTGSVVHRKDVSRQPANFTLDVDAARHFWRQMRRLSTLEPIIEARSGNERARLGQFAWKKSDRDVTYRTERDKINSHKESTGSGIARSSSDDCISEILSRDFSPWL